MSNSIAEILNNRNFSTEKSILIVSETRSGSTWLMELLYAVTNTVINWEPLHPELGVIPSKMKWGDRPFIPENDKNDDYIRLVHDILSLKRYSPWTIKYAGLQDCINADIVLTKCVRAVALLPWLIKNNAFIHKPIYLLRHPIAVVLSQFNAFHNEKSQLKQWFDIPDWINNERFIKHADFINQLETVLEKKIALWCINNIYTINHADRDKKWITIYYENLLLHPEMEFSRILNELGLNVSKELFDTVQFQEPSVTDFKDDFIKNATNQLYKWEARLTVSELLHIQAIFDYFGIRCYSAFNAMPLNT